MAQSDEACTPEGLQQAFRKKFGRPPNQGELSTLNGIPTLVNRRRMLQVILFAEEDLDITKISLPKIPENAGTDKVVDEELDPLAWRRIAQLCGNHASSFKSNTPPEPRVAPPQLSEFRSVKEQRAAVHDQQSRHSSRMSDVFAQRKARRMEERKEMMQRSQQHPKYAVSEGQKQQMRQDNQELERGNPVTSVTSAIAAKAVRPNLRHSRTPGVASSPSGSPGGAGSPAAGGSDEGGSSPTAGRLPPGASPLGRPVGYGLGR